MTPIEIDAFEFSRLKEQRTGEAAVAQLPRLSEECANDTGILNWSVAGGIHESGYANLKMDVAGEVQLICQRCLKPFSYVVESSTVLILARSELQADQIEVTVEDDSLDVIVVSPMVNLLELIEDEALLSIPQSPKHDQCPDSETAVALESAKSDKSPFAALRDLKQDFKH